MSQCVHPHEVEQYLQGQTKNPNQQGPNGKPVGQVTHEAAMRLVLDVMNKNTQRPRKPKKAHGQ